MLKAFLTGILLGTVAVAGGLYALPLVDQHREPSILSVATNGGTREDFHVNIPIDRIMIGTPNSNLPEGLEWPDSDTLPGVRTELFKLRNARDNVIGIAARTTADDGGVAVVDWTIHLPARGSLFYNMAADTTSGDGSRSGELRAGTREFATLTGQLRERWIADESGDDGAIRGRLTLEANYIGELEPVE